uniref:PHD-type domain-containing protein n=1 Tax=Arundo donax TaxID=35708 RepID=A0A0A9F3J9_ARUDO
MAALAGDASSPPPPASTSKGKGKMDAETEAAAEGAGKTCGICFNDARSAIPGELDCCAHHFCFVCIMAWGRVESRCPFCKARFCSIRRPPVPGRFPDERIVHVPERNQVYHPDSNGSSATGVADPYVDTMCSVCSCSRDDELLLLCELCDSAAHTYCVGLGTAVPEGDWFCKDCAVTREEHLRWQAENEGWGGQGEFEISIEVPRTEPVAAPSVSNVVDEDYDPSSVDRTDVRSSRLSMDDPVPSIYDIVGEDYTTNTWSYRRGRNAEGSPSQGTSDGFQCLKSTRGRDNGLASYHASIRLEVERARTLRNSRNLDKRIRELRENWATLRDGSVGFTAHVPNRRTRGTTGIVSVVTERHACAMPITISNKNGADAASVQLPSTPLSEKTTTSLGHHKISHKDTRDVRKAWKKLDMAKPSGGRKISNKPCSLNCTPPFSMGNRSTSYSPIDTILGQKNQNLPNKATQKINTNCGHGIKMESTPPTKSSGESSNLPENNRVSVHKRMVSFQNQINQESLNGEVASSIHVPHVDKELELLCTTGRSEKLKSDMLHPVKCSLSSGHSTVTSLQLGPSPGSQSAMIINPEDSSAVCVATTNEIGKAATIEVRKSSRPDRHERKRKLSSEKCHDQGSKRSRSACTIAKIEISSLAIRELKLLKIDKTYGSDRFKEVARTATHTVLAACGFENPTSQSLALSKPVCKHSSEVKPLKSSAIANSCTECLRNFVKEVIGLVLSSRQMDQTYASC